MSFMETYRRRVFVIGEQRALHPSIARILERCNIAVDSSLVAAAAVQRVQQAPYDLVIAHLPTSGVDPAALVRDLRSTRSASRKAGLLITGDEAGGKAATPLLGRGLNRFLPVTAPPAEWLDALADLLAVAPRRSVRALVQVEVEMGGSRNRTLAQTQDLSASGMLVRGDPRRYPLGSEIQFELILPGSPAPVAGTGTVVRYTDGERERIDGFGVRFQRLAADGRRRLGSFLSGR